MLWSAQRWLEMSPSGSAAIESLKRLKPKPALHIAGETDPLVRFEWQQRTMQAVRELNGCDTDGKPWEKNCTIYPSKTGTPFVAFIHPGGHGFPAEAPALIARFFKEHDAPKPLDLYAHAASRPAPSVSRTIH